MARGESEEVRSKAFEELSTLGSWSFQILSEKREDCLVVHEVASFVVTGGGKRGWYLWEAFG